MLLVSSVNAQTPTPYFTGFDNALQQAGWQKYRKGYTGNPFEWVVGNQLGGTPPSSPNYANHDYPVGGVPSLVVDWFVSPAFDFSTGGSLDSFKYEVFAFNGFTIPSDHFGVYLLQGSQDPSQATISQIVDLTSMASNVFNWQTTSQFIIPPTPGLCYFGFKYTADLDWFTIMLDNIHVSANPPCAVPPNVSAIPSFMSANITWSAVNSVDFYEYALNTNSTPPNAGNNTISTTYSANNLQLWTSYYFHIRTHCLGGYISSWKTIAFSTMQAPPPCAEPEDIQIKNVTENALRVEWKKNSISGYEYWIQRDSSLPKGPGWTCLVNYVDVNNLIPATKYYLFLRNRCEGINGWQFSKWTRYEFFTHFPSAVTDVVNEQQDRIFPNPVGDELFIVCHGLVTLTISDLTGKVLKTIAVDKYDAIDVRDLVTGIYLLRSNVSTIPPQLLFKR